MHLPQRCRRAPIGEDAWLLRRRVGRQAEISRATTPPGVPQHRRIPRAQRLRERIENREIDVVPELGWVA